MFLHNDHQEIIAVTYTEKKYIYILIINIYFLSINKYNAFIYVYMYKTYM